MTFVLWYNNTVSSYEYGSWTEYKNLLSGSVENGSIQALERFNLPSAGTLEKIVAELNKCRHSQLR